MDDKININSIAGTFEFHLIFSCTLHSLKYIWEPHWLYSAIGRDFFLLCFIEIHVGNYRFGNFIVEPFHMILLHD